MPREKLQGCPSRSEYSRGCRCAGCRKANADYVTRWRRRGVANGKRLLHGRLVPR